MSGTEQRQGTEEGKRRSAVARVASDPVGGVGGRAQEE